jgi:hypothetical protein
VFSAAHMSKAEQDFIRLYVQITHKRFDALQTVLSMAHPDNLALTDIVKAAELTTELSRLQNGFEAKIQQLQIKHNIPSKKTIPAGPTNEQLADIVVMSFFKVVGVMNAASGLVSKTKQNGWFSGKPKEWGTLLDKLSSDAADNHIDALLSTYMKSIAKFFPKYYPPNNWSKLFPPPQQNFYEEDDYEEDDYEDGDEYEEDWDDE